MNDAKKVIDSIDINIWDVIEKKYTLFTKKIKNGTEIVKPNTYGLTVENQTSLELKSYEYYTWSTLSTGVLEGMQ